MGLDPIVSRGALGYAAPMSIFLFILFVFFLGAIPSWPHSRNS